MSQGGNSDDSACCFFLYLLHIFEKVRSKFIIAFLSNQSMYYYPLSCHSSAKLANAVWVSTAALRYFILKTCLNVLNYWQIFEYNI